MPRTTIDLDASVLRRAKRLAKASGKSLSRVVSELLGAALATGETQPPNNPFSWRAKPMRARVDLEDKDALYVALEHKTQRG